MYNRSLQFKLIEPDEQKLMVLSAKIVILGNISTHLLTDDLPLSANLGSLSTNILMKGNHPISMSTSEGFGVPILQKPRRLLFLVEDLLL